MKNYRFLIPAALIALFALGVYMTGSGNIKEEAGYRQHLEDARNYASQEIEVYQEAIAMRPSPELYMEVARFYRDTMGNPDRAQEWGETMLAEYPREPLSYEFLLELYLQRDDPVAFFRLYNRMSGRNVESEAAREMYRSAEYMFYERGDYDEISIFGGNLAAARRNETWGYCNARGQRVIDSLYTYAGAFVLGTAPVIDGDGEAYFIDESGNKVVSVYAQGGIKELGILPGVLPYSVYDGNEWNYYSREGELLMGGFSDAATYANGLTAARSDEGWKVYDMDGNVKPGGPYEDVVMDEKRMAYRNERLFVGTDGGYVMIDGEGNRIGTDVYEEVKIFYDTTYAAAKKGGKWGFIDRDGNWFIEPTYEDARSFSNRYAAVQSGGVWGFINMDKELCIPCQFTDVRDFTAQGTAPVCRGENWSVLILYKDNC